MSGLYHQKKKTTNKQKKTKTNNIYLTTILHHEQKMLKVYSKFIIETQKSLRLCNVKISQLYSLIYLVLCIQYKLRPNTNACAVIKTIKHLQLVCLANNN